MGLYIHGKYLPPSFRLNMLLVGVLCWREFNLPSWLGWMLFTLWLLLAVCELARMFSQDAGHPPLQRKEPQA